MQLTLFLQKMLKKSNVIHSSSGNIKFTPYSDANDVTDKLFKWFLSRYQKILETSMKGSDLFST